MRTLTLIANMTLIVQVLFKLLFFIINLIFDGFEKCQKHDTKCKLDTNSGKNMTLNKNMTLIVNMTLIAETNVKR